MDATYAGDAWRQGGEGVYRASFPAVVPLVASIPPTAPAPAVPAGPNWGALGAIVAVHGLLLVALVKLDVIDIGHRAPPPPIVVELLADQPPPPPPPAAVEPEVAPVKPIQPLVVAPPPIVHTPAPPPAVAIVAEAPPPQAVVVAPTPKAAAVAAPVAVDLSASLVSSRPPRYPVESRKKREEGVVTLSVTVGADGMVADIAVAKSSGFERLDKAALDAVRHWRWSPTMRNGQAVAIKGYLPLTFGLQA